MSLVLDILRTYRAPRSVLRRRIGPAVREDRALATLMAACVLMFVAQWPRLAREAFFDASITLEARLAGALFGWLLVAPLALYVLALVSHGALRLAGSEARGYDTRMALFWAFLATAPLWLLSGLASGYLGSSLPAAVVSLAAFGAFVAFWVMGLAEIFGRRQTGVI